LGDVIARSWQKPGLLQSGLAIAELVIEIDRPVTGRINESQDAMRQLRATLRENPPASFSKFTQAAQAP
jgi:hypothetical protein